MKHQQKASTITVPFLRRTTRLGELLLTDRSQWLSVTAKWAQAVSSSTRSTGLWDAEHRKQRGSVQQH